MKKGARGGNKVSPARVPAWLWLVGVVAVSIVVRSLLARRMVAPWIMIDEIVYSELAKSFAADGQFAVRDVASNGYGFVYPVLLAPAWRIFDAVPDAYAVGKAINAVVMSLTAVPAYLLARRLLSPWLSLFAATLAILVPSMLYTGTLMTENAFYPLFVTAALALMLTLERPTPLRQVVLLAICALAYATRAQAIALVPAVATAPVLLVAFERRGLRGLRPFATLYGLLAAGAAAALVVTAARGRSPLDLLGAYQAATSSDYSVGEVLRFLLYHAGELSLYLGVLPFAALLALWLAPRDGPSAARAFAAASLSLVVWLVAEVAVFASQPSVDKIEERNMFYVAPLALIALVGLAADGLITRRRRPVVAAAALAALLPIFVPYHRFIGTTALADTFALLPWWWVQDHWITLGQVRWAVGGVALAAAGLFVLLPRRYALVLPALVGVYFLLTSFVVENGRHGIHAASLGKRWAGIRMDHPDWLDRAVGSRASVAVVRTDKVADEAIWENEFFNRSVGPVYALETSRRPDPLPETTVFRRADGRLVGPDGVVRAEYALVDGSVDVAGTPVTQDPRIGLRLYRVNGPLIVLTRVRGLYPTDTWSRRRVTYERIDCTGGRLTVSLQSDPALFRAAQTVVARHGNRIVGRAQIAPAGQAEMTVLLEAGPGGRCTVSFDVARTAVPAQVIPGSRDRRALGAHFLAFDYMK